MDGCSFRRYMSHAIGGIIRTPTYRTINATELKASISLNAQINKCWTKVIHT